MVLASHGAGGHHYNNKRSYGEGSLKTYQCTGTCKKTQYHKACMTFFQKCCNKCLCVPGGYYGPKEVCPCYNNWKTNEDITMSNPNEECSSSHQSVDHAIIQACGRALTACLQNPKKALKLANELCSKHNEHSSVHYTKGRILANIAFALKNEAKKRQKLFMEAQECLELARKLSPNDFMSSFTLAKVRFELASDHADYAKVIGECERVLTLDMSNVANKENLIAEIKLLKERAKAGGKPSDDDAKDSEELKHDGESDHGESVEKASLDVGDERVHDSKTQQDLRIRIEERKLQRTTEFMKTVGVYWCNLSYEDKCRILNVPVSDILSFYGKGEHKNPKALSVLKEAVEWYGRKGHWVTWLCCFCEEQEERFESWDSIGKHIDWHFDYKEPKVEGFVGNEGSVDDFEIIEIDGNGCFVLDKEKLVGDHGDDIIENNKFLVFWLRNDCDVIDALQGWETREEARALEGLTILAEFVATEEEMSNHWEALDKEEEKSENAKEITNQIRQIDGKLLSLKQDAVEQSAYDYRCILLSLLKPFIQVRLESLAEEDARVRADAAMADLIDNVTLEDEAISAKTRRNRKKKAKRKEKQMSLHEEKSKKDQTSAEHLDQKQPEEEQKQEIEFDDPDISEEKGEEKMSDIQELEDATTNAKSECDRCSQQNTVSTAPVTLEDQPVSAKSRRNRRRNAKEKEKSLQQSGPGEKTSINSQTSGGHQDQKQQEEEQKQESEFYDVLNPDISKEKGEEKMSDIQELEDVTANAKSECDRRSQQDTAAAALVTPEDKLDSTKSKTNQRRNAKENEKQTPLQQSGPGEDKSKNNQTSARHHDHKQPEEEQKQESEFDGVLNSDISKEKSKEKMSDIQELDDAITNAKPECNRHSEQDTVSAALVSHTCQVVDEDEGDVKKRPELTVQEEARNTDFDAPEFVKKIGEYWCNLSYEEKSKILDIHVSEIERFYGSGKQRNPKSLSILKEAVEWHNVKGHWSTWSCCLCEEQEENYESYSSIEKHMSNHFPHTDPNVKRISGDKDELEIDSNGYFVLDKKKLIGDIGYDPLCLREDSDVNAAIERWESRRETRVKERMNIMAKFAAVEAEGRDLWVMLANEKEEVNKIKTIKRQIFHVEWQLHNLKLDAIDQSANDYRDFLLPHLKTLLQVRLAGLAEEAARVRADAAMPGLIDKVAHEGKTVSAKKTDELILQEERRKMELDSQEFVDKTGEYWRNLNYNRKCKILKVDIKDLRSFYAAEKHNNERALSILTDAVILYRKRWRWTTWSCCFCEQDEDVHEEDYDAPYNLEKHIDFHFGNSHPKVEKSSGHQVHGDFDNLQFNDKGIFMLDKVLDKEGLDRDHCSNPTANINFLIFWLRENSNVELAVESWINRKVPRADKAYGIMEEFAKVREEEAKTLEQLEKEKQETSGKTRANHSEKMRNIDARKLSLKQDAVRNSVHDYREIVIPLLKSFIQDRIECLAEARARPTTLTTNLVDKVDLECKNTSEKSNKSETKCLVKEEARARADTTFAHLFDNVNHERKNISAKSNKTQTKHLAEEEARARADTKFTDFFDERKNASAKSKTTETKCLVKDKARVRADTKFADLVDNANLERKNISAKLNKTETKSLAKEQARVRVDTTFADLIDNAILQRKNVSAKSNKNKSKRAYRLEKVQTSGEKSDKGQMSVGDVEANRQEIEPSQGREKQAEIQATKENTCKGHVKLDQQERESNQRSELEATREKMQKDQISVRQDDQKQAGKELDGRSELNASEKSEKSCGDPNRQERRSMQASELETPRISLQEGYEPQAPTITFGNFAIPITSESSGIHRTYIGSIPLDVLKNQEGERPNEDIDKQGATNKDITLSNYRKRLEQEENDEFEERMKQLEQLAEQMRDLEQLEEQIERQ